MEFRAGYSASISSYSLVHECACACIPYTNVHANVLSLTACQPVVSPHQGSRHFVVELETLVQYHSQN